MTQLLLFSGSQRQDSFNQRLLNHLASHLSSTCSFMSVTPFAKELPLFDQDLELNEDHITIVSELIDLIQSCDGILVASPEYNGQFTPYLKNVVDWVSRLAHISPEFQNPFIDKPVLLSAASTGGSGGAMGLGSARALFGYVGCVVFGETVTVPFAHQAWTEAGYFFDPDFEAHMSQVCDRFLHLVEK